MRSPHFTPRRPAAGESAEKSPTSEPPAGFLPTYQGLPSQGIPRERLVLAIERGVAQRSRRGQGPPIQRTISDEVEPSDEDWTSERALAYFNHHGLLDSVMVGLDLKGSKADFLKPLILAKIVELGKAEEAYDQAGVAAAARTAAQYMADQMKPIKEAHTFDSAEPQVDFWMYSHDDSMQEAWGKLMLGRLKHLIHQPVESALPEIKDLIRRTTSFDQEHEHFSILRQMALMLKDYEAKDQLVDEFEFALGSSFIATPGADENRHRTEAMVEVGDAVVTGPKKNAFAQKIMAEVRHLTKGKPDLHALSLKLQVTLLKVRKHLIKLGFTTGNVQAKSLELGFAAADELLLDRVLALDPEAFLVERFLKDRDDTAEFKRIAAVLQVEGLDAITSPSDLTAEQVKALKNAIAVEETDRNAQIDQAVEADAGVVKANYTLLIQKILAVQEADEVLDPLFQQQSIANHLNQVSYYATETLYSDVPPAKERLLAIKQGLLLKPDIADAADHVKDAWLGKAKLRTNYTELLDSIRTLDLNPDHLVDALPAIEPDQLQEVGIALDKHFFASVMGGIVDAEVNLSAGYLPALQAAEGDQLVRLAYFMRFVPKAELLAEYKTLLAAHPDQIEALNQKLFSVTKIDLNAGGGITALSAPITRVLLETVSFPGHPDKWKASAVAIKGKLAEDHHLEALDEEYQELFDHVHEKTLGTDVFTLGRTVIFPQGGNAIAVKLLKAGESVSEFHKELAMQKYLAAKKEELGLKSDYPTAIGTFTVDETTFGRLQQRILTGMTATKEKAVQDEEPKVKDIALEAGAHKCTVMLYKAPKNYFLYQNQAGLSSVAFRGALPAPDEESLTAGRANFFEDAMILLREGVGFPQLIDLNHNSERIYNWMIDVSRVFETSLQGMGKISNWKTAARYPNMRASGLADLGDMALLDEVEVDYTSEDSTNEQESSSGKIWSLQDQQKQKMFTAQYLGTYVLSSILTEAHGFFVTEKKQMVGSHAIEEQAMTEARPTLIARLSDVLKTAFKTFTKTFRDVDNTEALYGSIIKAKDVEELADQMIFIMSGQYVKHLQEDMLTGDAADYTLADDPGTSFKDKLDSLSPAKAIEAMKPLKDQQASASTARQALGDHGIYSIPIDRDGDSWVKKGDIEHDTQADPSHPFAVDLGFVNGPQPIPKLQDILYKLVTYAMLNVSK